MELKFTKMHGCGNDYVYVNCFGQKITDASSLAVRISNRRFSVGGDGLILICPPTDNFSDVRMEIYNADGSRAKMCGNGIRCVAKYAYDSGLAKKREMNVETDSGVKKIRIIPGDYDKAVGAAVDMGAAEFCAEKVPVVGLDKERIVDYPFEAGGETLKITCVSIGNPHCVIFTETPVNELDLPALGKKFEKNPIFPEGVNTEFVNVIDGSTLKMRVWERGSGETQACGTGACAVVSAAVANGISKEGEDVRVKLAGGELVINYTNERVLMTGPAVTVFEGVTEI